MSRKPILALCTFNAILAGFVLYVGLPKLLNKPANRHTNTATKEEKSTDDELWLMALSSNIANQTAYYLNQIEDHNFKRLKLSEELRDIADVTIEDKSSVGKIQRTCALIEEWARLAKPKKDQTLLILISENRTLPITLRKSALIHYIQASLQNYQSTNSPTELNLARQVLDQAYTEQNSLKGLALKADWFLIQNSEVNPERTDLFKQRLTQTLLDSHTLEINQITGIELLQSPQLQTLIATETLYSLYTDNRSDALKAAILTQLAKQADPQSEGWLNQQTMYSPKLEQLQAAALQAVRAKNNSKPH